MAIVKMNKFSLFIFPKDKDKLLDRLQKLSKVEFIDLKNKIAEEDYNNLSKYSESNLISELESKKYRLKFVIDTINKFSEEKKSIKDALKEKKSFYYDELAYIEQDASWENIYDDVKEKEDNLNSFTNEVSKLKSDIEILAPWQKLDINLVQLKSSKSCEYFIGSMPKRYEENFRCSLENSIKYYYIEKISEIKEEVNIFLVIHKDLKEQTIELLKKHSFTKVALNYDESPFNIISQLNDRIKYIEQEKEDIMWEIKEYSNKLENLKIIQEYFENEINKAYACENFIKTNNVIEIDGWLPEYSNELLQSKVSEITKDYYIEFSEPLDEDNVPIMLNNNALVRPFEFITATYSLPKYGEIDPTPLLVPFYLIFFGMMLSDAGYGLLMLIASFIALKFILLDDERKLFVKLFFYLSIPTIFWGIMYGSFFTGFIDIPAIWMKPEENANLLLLIAIIFGLIQIYAGLGIKAYLLIRNKKYLDAFYDVGLWYITLTSVLLYLAGNFADITALQGSLNTIKYIMIAGMIGLVLTQGRENAGVGAKLGAGLYGLYGITGYIGDLVSYSRLMALGLATGFIGGALNLIISFLGNGFKAWLFGPIIFIIGHVFNLLINALGAYVHTSRLQYVEYFGKFYEGGGKPFTPFKYINKFIKIKSE